MHLRIAPSKSGAHRLACKSLYRAFLRQCDRFPTPPTSSNDSSKSYDLRTTLRSLVRHRFQQDRRLKGHHCVRDALQFGRGALQLLENAATGSSQALSEMTRILSKSTSMAAQRSKISTDLRLEQTEHSSLSPKLAKRKEQELYHADKSNSQRKPDTVHVLDRPVPYEQALKHKDGRRRVPAYFVAQGVPFLRYTKKQPAALSRLITWQIREHEKNWDLTYQREDIMRLAEAEDEWDRYLAETQPLLPSESPDDGGSVSSTWAAAHAQTLDDSHERQAQRHHRRVEYGKKLFDVFLKEKALARIENAAREAEKKEGLEENDSTAVFRPFL